MKQCEPAIADSERWIIDQSKSVAYKLVRRVQDKNIGLKEFYYQMENALGGSRANSVLTELVSMGPDQELAVGVAMWMEAVAKHKHTVSATVIDSLPTWKAKFPRLKKVKAHAIEGGVPLRSSNPNEIHFSLPAELRSEEDCVN